VIGKTANIPSKVPAFISQPAGFILTYSQTLANIGFFHARSLDERRFLSRLFGPWEWHAMDRKIAELAIQTKLRSPTAPATPAR